MPITKSAEKALRQSARKRVQNLKKKLVLKTLIKNYRQAAAKEKKEMIAKVYRAIDKAAKTNVVKKGRAARLKSRLSKLATRV